MPIAKPAVLVVSCDKYADLWRPFFALFGKRWPDCPYPVYLGTNHRTFDHPQVKTLAIGEDRSWADSVRRMLDQIERSHVLLFLEDFLLERTVNSAKIEMLVHFAQQHELGCLRLTPVPGPTRRLRDNESIGLIQKGDDYRVSTQVAVWRTDTLLRLLRPEYSPWDFELQGSPLSSELAETFCSVWKPAIEYTQSVVRGKWRPIGLQICEQANLAVDLDARPGIEDEPLRLPFARRFRRQFSRELPKLIRKYARRPAELPALPRRAA